MSVNFYIPMLLLMKSAILFDWIRLLLPAGNRSTCFWACQTLAWIHILFYVAEMFAWNLACTPYARNWDSSVAGSCIDYKAIDMCSAVMNLAIDLVMLLLPLKWIRLRETEAQTRLGMLVIFGIGLLYVYPVDRRQKWGLEVPWWHVTSLAGSGELTLSF